MKVVLQFEIPMSGLQEVNMPFGAQPLSVQEWDGGVKLWCLCDPEMTLTETRSFRLLRTGEESQENSLAFIGTVQVNDGEFVLHLFEVKP
jgi:hypothetical protein